MLHQIHNTKLLSRVRMVMSSSKPRVDLRVCVRIGGPVRQLRGEAIADVVTTANIHGWLIMLGNPKLPLWGDSKYPHTGAGPLTEVAADLLGCNQPGGLGWAEHLFLGVDRSLLQDRNPKTGAAVACGFREAIARMDMLLELAKQGEDALLDSVVAYEGEFRQYAKGKRIEPGE